MATGKRQKGQETIVVRIGLPNGGSSINAFKSSGGVEYFAGQPEREDVVGGYTQRDEINAYIEGEFCVPCELNQKILGSLCDLTITATFSCKVITFRDAWIQLGAFNTAEGTQTIKFACIPDDASEDIIETASYDELLASITDS